MSTTATITTSSSSVRTHAVVLKTRTQYVIPFEKYMIPVTWRRFHLSQLINKVLALPQPIPFDFIIQGEMLRTSLGEWTAAKGVEEEDTLEIEYIESVLPPEKVASVPHPDWVSSIDCGLKGYFLTGSYDTCVRLYNESRELIHTIPGHQAPVSSVCAISPASDAIITSDGSQLIASASYDSTARLVSVPLDLSPVDPENPDSPENRPLPTPLASLYLHTSALSSISASLSGRNILTGGWDNLVGVWSTDIPDSDEVDEVVYPISGDRKKRRKVTKDEPTVVRKAPLNVLKSHTNRVSAVAWSPSEANCGFSCGWDFTVRMWDVEAGVCTNTFTSTERAMLDLAVTCNGKTVVTANGDRTVSIFSVTNPGPATNLPHNTPVTAVSAHPTSAHHIISGCMDGTVRIWDLRSTQSALESFVASGDQQSPPETGKAQQRSKILSLDWSRGSLIGCAGELGIDIFKANIGN